MWTVRDVSVSVKYAGRVVGVHTRTGTRSGHVTPAQRRRRLSPIRVRRIGRPLGHRTAGRGAPIGSAHQPQARRPHIVLRVARRPALPCPPLRVFQSGSVIIVSRWPEEMRSVHGQFVENMDRLRKRVIDPEFARQRTITECWKRFRAA